MTVFQYEAHRKGIVERRLCPRKEENIETRGARSLGGNFARWPEGSLPGAESAETVGEGELAEDGGCPWQ